MKVLFAGGGTGGHIYPAVALADALRRRADILFAGTADRLEHSIVPAAGYAFGTVAARPLQRRLSLETLATAAVNAAGFAQAASLVARFQPDVVVATGGYVCFPVMSAAKMLRASGRIHAPLALLEPNAQPGLTNRLLAPMVDEVWGAFADARPYFGKKFVQTGIPVRSSLLHPNNRIEAARRLGLDVSRRTILVVGGSQGARSINEAVAALATRRALPPDWQFLHVCGERDYAYMRAEESRPLGDNRIVLVPYLADMADAYAVSDLTIARSGASTAGELIALGMPSILVPYPFASDDHQRRNARALEACGAAVVIDDARLNADSLWWTLRDLMERPKLNAMRAAARALAPGDAAGAIVARIDGLVSRTKRP